MATGQRGRGGEGGERRRKKKREAERREKTGPKGHTRDSSLMATGQREKTRERIVEKRRRGEENGREGLNVGLIWAIKRMVRKSENFK